MIIEGQILISDFQFDQSSAAYFFKGEIAFPIVIGTGCGGKTTSFKEA